MGGGAVAELIAMIAIFLGGVVCGVIVMVSRAIKREDRRFSLTGTAPDASARGARLLTGAGSRRASGRPAGSRDAGPPEQLT